MVGTSIWEISRVCMRVCIELELHLSPLLPIDPLQEQLNRRVFWEYYLLDRYCSTTLGRPFAIADQDIEVNLPALVPDEEVTLCQPGHLDDLPSRLYVQSTAETNCMEVFVFYVRLRRITSRIHDAFFSTCSKSSSKSPKPGYGIDIIGESYAKLYALFKELETWRASAPIYPQANSMYQREQWYDFLLEKERLLLIRGIMNALPTHQGVPHKNLISLCQNTAMRVIELYSDMFLKRQINVTRGYFQMLFSAGLLLVYCLSSSSAKLSAPTAGKAVLMTLTQVLWEMSETMIDARRYAVMFDFIRESSLSEASSRDDHFERQLNAAESDTNQQVVPLDDDNLASSGPQPIDHSLNMHPINELWHMPTVPDYSDLQASQTWFMKDWDPFMSQFMAGMEADVNRFACDGFSNDVMMAMGQGFGLPQDQMQTRYWM